MATALSSPRLQPSGTHEAVGPETSLRGVSQSDRFGRIERFVLAWCVPCGWWPARAGSWWASRSGAAGSGDQSYRFAGESFDDVADQVAGSWGDRVACWPYLDARVPIHW